MIIDSWESALFWVCLLFESKGCRFDSCWAHTVNVEIQWVNYFANRLYSSIFQHERKKEQSLHVSALFISTKYCLPGIFVTFFSIISVMQGGVCDLQPCLLSQFMQKPFLGFIIWFLLVPSEYNTSFQLKTKKMPGISSWNGGLSSRPRATWT